MVGNWASKNLGSQSYNLTELSSAMTNELGRGPQDSAEIITSACTLISHNIQM